MYMYLGSGYNPNLVYGLHCIETCAYMYIFCCRFWNKLYVVWAFIFLHMQVGF